MFLSQQVHSIHFLAKFPKTLLQNIHCQNKETLQELPLMKQLDYSGIILQTPTKFLLRFCSHLQPMLQDAIQKQSSISQSSSLQNVKGPLTWSEFVRVGNKDHFKADLAPLPVPRVQVSCNRSNQGIDNVHVGPESLKFWDKVGIQPNASRKDIYYLAIIPDSTFIQNKVKR